MLKRSTTLVVVVRHSAVSEDKTFLIFCFYCLSLLLSCFPFSSLPPLIPPFFSPSSSSVETWWRGLARTTLSTTWWPRISELTQVGRGRWGGEGKGKRGGGEEWGRERGRCMYLRANPVTLYLQLIQRLVCSPDKKREEEDLKELDAKNKITKDMVREDVCIHMYPQP